MPSRKLCNHDITTILTALRFRQPKQPAEARRKPSPADGISTNPDHPAATGRLGSTETRVADGLERRDIESGRHQRRKSDGGESKSLTDPIYNTKICQAGMLQHRQRGFLGYVCGLGRAPGTTTPALPSGRKRPLMTAKRLRLGRHRVASLPHHCRPQGFPRPAGPASADRTRGNLAGAVPATSPREMNDRSLLQNSGARVPVDPL